MLHLILFVFAVSVGAGTTGFVRLTGLQPNEKIAFQRVDMEGGATRTLKADPNGVVEVQDLEGGMYEVRPQGREAFLMELTSGSTLEMDLGPKREEDVTVIVRTKRRRLIRPQQSTSQSTITRAQMVEQPMGSEVAVPKLIAATTAGAVPGAMGKIYFRGNHGSIQYQIDGVQMPDTPNASFGSQLGARNMERMEVLTGGFPAEYGLRLGAVVNIQTKGGTSQPTGEVELNYGSWHTTRPHVLFGGQNASGTLRYFGSLNGHYTQRAMDTPQPVSEKNQDQGGADSIHNLGWGHGQFFKVDIVPDGVQTLTLTGFQQFQFAEMPNYPEHFGPNHPLFQEGFKGKYNTHADHGDHKHVSFIYKPKDTNNRLEEQTAYFQAAYKRTFGVDTSLFIAPFYRYSMMRYVNDPVRDLVSAQDGAFPQKGADPSSTGLERSAHSGGLKGDVQVRITSNTTLKSGTLLQTSFAHGQVQFQKLAKGFKSQFSQEDRSFTESLYTQAETRWFPWWHTNFGLRFDAVQYQYLKAKESSQHMGFGPRLGSSFMVTDQTKIHAYYGYLFQPAPLENFRTVFQGYNRDASGVYDIKPERGHYVETGVRQEWLDQVWGLVGFVKWSTDVLDEAQLLDTGATQTINYKEGFAYGVEVSLKGQLLEGLSDYFNYSYVIARGRHRAGGSWAGHDHGSDGSWIMLDHVQDHTANAGLHYRRDKYWGALQGEFGSGLRADCSNSVTLPAHFTLSASLGVDLPYGFKAALDVMNIFDNRYPVTIANEFNRSNYADGRRFFLRLTKEI